MYDRGPGAHGRSFLVGGGLQGFTARNARDTTDVGGTWEARFGFGTRDILGFEAAYVGSTQELNALGLDRDAMLTSHGVEGNLRLNMSNTQVVPYIFTGAGWRRYSITNADINLSSIRDVDNVMEIPAGAGLTWRISSVIVDLRGVFRFAVGNDLMQSDDLHTLSVRGNVGWEF
jgi:hypothetical protein